MTAGSFSNNHLPLQAIRHTPSHHHPKHRGHITEIPSAPSVDRFCSTAVQQYDLFGNAIGEYPLCIDVHTWPRQRVTPANSGLVIAPFGVLTKLPAHPFVFASFPFPSLPFRPSGSLVPTPLSCLKVPRSAGGLLLARAQLPSFSLGISDYPNPT